MRVMAGEGDGRADGRVCVCVLHQREYVLGIECFVRLDRHGSAPQRARASIGPYCVARARTPRALHRSMTADRLIPRHGHGGVCSSICVAPGPRRCGDGRRVGWLLAQRCLGRLLHRGGTAA